MKVLTCTLMRAAAHITSLIVILLGAADSAAAQQPSQAQASAIRSACRSDYRSRCATVPTGGAAALQCLQKNVASLSPPCQHAVNAVGGGAPATPAVLATPATPVTSKLAAPAAAAAPATPATPVTSTPTTAAPNASTKSPVGASVTPSAPAAPPKPVASKLASAAPAAAAAKSAVAVRPNKAQSAAIRSACRADYQSYCPGIPPGGTAAWSCLQAKVASFSPPCQQAVHAVTGGKPTGRVLAAPPGGAPPVATPARPSVVRVVTPREVLFLMRTACGGDFRTYCPEWAWAADALSVVLRPRPRRCRPTAKAHWTHWDAELSPCEGAALRIDHNNARIGPKIWSGALLKASGCVVRLS